MQRSVNIWRLATFVLPRKIYILILSKFHGIAAFLRLLQALEGAIEFFVVESLGIKLLKIQHLHHRFRSCIQSSGSDAYCALRCGLRSESSMLGLVLGLLTYFGARVFCVEDCCDLVFRLFIPLILC